MLELIQAMDESALLFIQEHLRVSILDPLMVLVSTLGNAGMIWILLGVVLTIIPKTRKMGVLALSSLLVCFLINNGLLKNLVARPRPYTQIAELVMLMECPSDHSFPSGHTCAAFAVAGSLLWSGRKRLYGLRIPALLLAVMTGWSRLYVGVHYPTDVLAACVIGLLGSYIVTKALSPVYDRLDRR